MASVNDLSHRSSSPVPFGNEPVTQHSRSLSNLSGSHRSRSFSGQMEWHEHCPRPPDRPKEKTIEEVTRDLKEMQAEYLEFSRGFDEAKKAIAVMIGSSHQTDDLQDLLKAKVFYKGKMDDYSGYICQLEIDLYLRNNHEEAWAAALTEVDGEWDAVDLEAFFQGRLRFFDQLSKQINEGCFPTSAEEFVSAEMSVNSGEDTEGDEEVGDAGSVVLEGDDWKIQARLEVLVRHQYGVQRKLEEISAEKEVRSGRSEEGRVSHRSGWALSDDDFDGEVPVRRGSANLDCTGISPRRKSLEIELHPLASSVGDSSRVEQKRSVVLSDAPSLMPLTDPSNAETARITVTNPALPLTSISSSSMLVPVTPPGGVSKSASEPADLAAVAKSAGDSGAKSGPPPASPSRAKWVFGGLFLVAALVVGRRFFPNALSNGREMLRSLWSSWAKKA